MAPPTKAVRMARALDAAAQAHTELERLAYVARAAKVKRDIHLRRARHFGASLRAIEAHVGVQKDTADRICKGPEPTLERDRSHTA